MGDLRRLIAAARSRVVQTVNAELVSLYWHVGDSLNGRLRQRIRRDILNEERAEYGKQVVEVLSSPEFSFIRAFFPIYKGVWVGTPVGRGNFRGVGAILRRCRQWRWLWLQGVVKAARASMQPPSWRRAGSNASVSVAFH